MEEKEKEFEAQADTDTEKKSEEMIPQSQVGGIVAKETKQAVEKLLKELGVEDVKSAKEGLKLFKEQQEAQKTELQKALDTAEDYKTKAEKAMERVKNTEIDTGARDILKEMEVDTKHLRTILKLADLEGVYGDELDAEKLKLAINKTIEEELPMLINDENHEKIGKEKGTEKKMELGSSEFLDAYKKMKK